jgi:hypothetical protein
LFPLKSRNSSTKTKRKEDNLLKHGSERTTTVYHIN